MPDDDSSENSSTGRRKSNEFVKSSCAELMELISHYEIPERENSLDEQLACYKIGKFRRSQTDMLKDLERFIERELRLRYDLKGDEFESSFGKQTKIDIRLMIMKEALAVVQENIPGYRSVLSKIQKAYDEAIQVRDERLTEFEVMKSALLKMQKDVECQKSSIWEDAMLKMLNLKYERLELIQAIDEANDENRNMKATVREMGEELEKSHAKLLEEIDARRLVAYEFSQLSEQVEILRNKAMGPAQKQEKADVDDRDPVVLNLALEKCREALAKAQTKVTYLETMYTDVCPLREYEQLSKEYKELEKMNAKLLSNAIETEKQINSLEENVIQAKAEKKQMEYRLREVERTGSPRVDWRLCAQYVPGGEEAWERSTAGMSSSQKFIRFLEELSKPIDFGDSYFSGLGSNPEVPAYLRFEGKIFNRKYLLRDARVIINNVWKSKLEMGNFEPMAEYLAEYAQRAFSLPGLQAELTYNLVEACKRYNSDPQVKLFYSILTGECKEEMYRAQLKELERIREEVRRKLLALRSKYLLTSAAFCDTLRNAFPAKPERDVMALLEAATSQLNITIGKPLDMMQLLFKDWDEGLEGKTFGRELGEQFRAARQRHIADILQSITDGTSPENEGQGVTMSVLKRALTDADPSLRDPELDSYARRLFRMSPAEAVDEKKAISLDVLEKRLREEYIERNKLRKESSSRVLSERSKSRSGNEYNQNHLT